MLDTTAYNRRIYEQMYKGAAEGNAAPHPSSTVDGFDYSSIDHYNIAQKIEFLKRPDFNPQKLKNPYDELNAQMYRWNQIAHNVEAGSYTDEQKKIIADQAYGRMLLPAWKRAGQEEMPLAVWREHAYDMGKNFDMDRSYRGSLYMGGTAGTLSVLQDAIQATKTLTNLVGAFVSPPKPITDENWAAQAKKTANNMNNPEGFWDQLQALADTNKILPTAKIRAALNRNSDKVSFLQHVRPAHGFVAGVTSRTVEAIPFVAATALTEGTSLLPEAASSLPVIIGTGRAGRLAEIGLGALRAGAEGSVYGALTKPYDSKQEAFNDALNWAVGSVLFRVGGKALGYIGGKIVDFKNSREEAAILDYWKKNGEKLKAGVKDIDSEDVEHESEVARSEQIATYGLAGTRSADNAAAEYLAKNELEGRSPEEVQTHERNLLTNGTPEDRIFLDSVARLRGGLAGDKLTELSFDQKASLLARLVALDGKAAGRMTKNVAVLQEALRQRYTSMDPAKLDKNVLSMLAKQVAPTLPQGASAQDILKASQAKWADYVVEAQKYAEEELTNDPFGEAKKAQLKKATALRENPLKPISYTQRTRRTVNKAGEPAVSYSINPEWKVYAKNALKQKGKDWSTDDIRQWLDDLDEDDFATDLHAFFLPKFMKEGDMHFESGSVTGGKDHSNLYAFMWNFKDQMPKEYQEKLSEYYMHSPKMGRFFDQIRASKAPVEEKQRQEMYLMRKISLAMWNHVDNFLASGRFPKESNIFRSTQSDLMNPTVWQKELFQERVEHEIQIIDKMYKRNTPPNAAAKNVLKAMFKSRFEAFKLDEQAKLKFLNESIASKLKEDSKGKRERWGIY